MTDLLRQAVETDRRLRSTGRPFSFTTDTEHPWARPVMRWGLLALRADRAELGRRELYALERENTGPANLRRGYIRDRETRGLGW